MEECLFCKIIKGEVPSKTIYEDEEFKVFMNINPETNGDLLLIPKRHILDYKDLTLDELSKMHELTIMLNSKLDDKLNINGLQLIANSGCYQEIKHFHLHVTPGYEKKEEIEDLDKIYEKLTN